MTYTASHLSAVLRTDLMAFTEKVFRTVSPGSAYQEGWHIDAMTHALSEVFAGRCKRLLTTIPPRHMKSICTAVAFPAWVLGHNPACKILVASYGDALALKHARDFRMVVESDWYARLFPATVRGALRSAESEFITRALGFRRAVSLNGALTGFGADFIIVDDLMKAADANSAVERQRVKDFYQQTLYSRLDNKSTGAIIAIQQRLHEDDLAGYLIDKGEFTHLNLPSLAVKEEVIPLARGRSHRRRAGDVLFEAMEPRRVLDQTRVEIGPAAFSAQYQQDPTPPEGNLVRWHMIPTYDEAPLREECLSIMQSWDVAVTATPQSDFSACSTWGFRQGCWYLLDMLRVRLEFPELVGRVRAHRKRWNPEVVLVERTGAGRPLYDELLRDYRLSTSERERSRWRVQPADPTSDKITRFAGQTAKLESGFVLFPASAAWLDDLRREFTAFPNGRFDDQVDCITQFLEHLYVSRRARALERNFLGPSPRPRPSPVRPA